MGGKKKGKKGGKKSDAEAEPAESGPKLLPQNRENYIYIDFRLLNWKYMNFKQKFSETTHIFTIKKILAERHGLMRDLKVQLHFPNLHFFPIVLDSFPRYLYFLTSTPLSDVHRIFH